MVNKKTVVIGLGIVAALITSAVLLFFVPVRLFDKQDLFSVEYVRIDCDDIKSERNGDLLAEDFVDSLWDIRFSRTLNYKVTDDVYKLTFKDKNMGKSVVLTVIGENKIRSGIFVYECEEGELDELMELISEAVYDLNIVHY